MIKLAWGEPMEILEMLTGKFIQEPHYFNKFEFSCQIFLYILPFGQKIWWWKDLWFESFPPNYLFKLRQQKTHPEKNWREFWIAWNIGAFTYQINRFLKMIYLYRLTLNSFNNGQYDDNFIDHKLPRILPVISNYNTKLYPITRQVRKK